MWNLLMWNQTRLTVITLGAAMFALSAVPHLRADEFDKKTVMTFSGPVEISGDTLPAGTYVFKTLRDDRNVVEVINANEDHVVGVFRTIGIIAPDIPDEPRVELSEGKANRPQAVHAWFYRGESLGWEFPAGKTK